MTRRPQTTRPLNPSFPRDSRPLSVRTVIHGDCPGLVLGRQHRCEPPPQRARAPCPRKSGHRSRSEHRRSPSASSFPPGPPTQMLWIPACAGMTAKGRPPIRRPEPRPVAVALSRCSATFFPAVVTAPPLCSPTKTFEGRHPGELVSPLQDIICSEDACVVHFSA